MAHDVVDTRGGRIDGLGGDGWGFGGGGHFGTFHFIQKDLPIGEVQGFGVLGVQDYAKPASREGWQIISQIMVAGT
jgi:hypothetical protein